MLSDASTTQATARIVVVDDHPIVRRGLIELINDVPEFDVVGEAPDVSTALDVLSEVRPDLALIDLSLGDGHGLELIKQIRAAELNIKMLVVSMMDEALYADRVLRAGASGYLRKEQATENIITAIRQVLDNKIYLSPSATARVLNRVATNESPAQSPVSTLSDRELEVFELLGDGLSSRDIAARLHLSVKTVETYREKIKTKLSLKNGSELTRHAIHWAMRKGE
ncbi:response regulator transcription factor [Algisphaera agarilytica]|uniref:DNA-binding NarL/FixJ family response regulator n=1 Tax=Algisphaera agarilytica TaxID=1385975 RepID=A0A7X0LJM9_9BACT|nr:response regulator transcription factor [Algisphaera agarilytica]MBB6429002.1 DNA-binding NarL/FixJ family response regulator [Algisphaera agarilytica]